MIHKAQDHRNRKAMNGIAFHDIFQKNYKKGRLFIKERPFF